MLAIVAGFALGALLGATVAWRVHARKAGAGRTADPADRVRLLAEIDRHLTAAVRSGSLLFVDLDRFRTINDSLGHNAGDEVLTHVAARLTDQLPEGALLARLSSDEYVVFAPTLGLLDAEAFAARALSALRGPFAAGGVEVFTTASIGVADVLAAGSGPHALRHAETAMRDAKRSGGNTIAVFDESMQHRASHRLDLDVSLHRALERHEFEVHYQPIVDLEHSEVVGFEALIRWRRADGTQVSPAEFITVAEYNGTIVEIGAWVLDEALGQLRAWIAEGVCAPTSTMSVNVSPRQLAEPDFAAAVGQSLRRAMVPAGQLWLEITETAMITEPDVALACVHDLRSLGVRIALDDFGTGFSSLSLLQRFPLQRLKIDRAFVAGVAEQANDTALVRTIVAMARSLHLDIVAEGVETVQQLQVVSELGCGKAQGFLLCRPLPPAELASWMSQPADLGRP